MSGRDFDGFTVVVTGGSTGLGRAIAVETARREIQRLNELYAGTNQIGFIGRLHADGAPVLSQAFARVKRGAGLGLGRGGSVDRIERMIAAREARQERAEGSRWVA